MAINYLPIFQFGINLKAMNALPLRVHPEIKPVWAQ